MKTGTNSRGPTHIWVRVIEVGDDIAQVIDQHGRMRPVTTQIVRTSMAPKVDEWWIIDQSFGTWTFAARATGLPGALPADEVTFDPTELTHITQEHVQGALEDLDGAVEIVSVSALVVPYAGATAPTGFLMCNGSAISRTTYADLFAVVGTTYGVGDGSTTFNLPDLRGRTIVGVGQGSGLTNRALGATGGAETHQLSWDEMPTHTHIQNAHTHAQYPHHHGPGTGAEYFSVFFDPGGTENNNTGSGDDNIYGSTTTTDTVAYNYATTAVNQNSGGDQAHNNMQPFTALNFIIKT